MIARLAPPVTIAAREYVAFVKSDSDESDKVANVWKIAKHLQNRRAEKMIASCFRVGSFRSLKPHNEIQMVSVKRVSKVVLSGTCEEGKLCPPREERAVVLSRLIDLEDKKRHCIALLTYN